MGVHLSLGAVTVGSFNVGCGLSHLSIGYGDRTGIVILDQSPTRRYAAHVKNGRTGTSCYVNPADLYAPLLPPVYGTYNDYGSIEDIEPSATTRMLENMFGRPIDAIMDCLTSPDDGFYERDRGIGQHYLIVSHKLGAQDVSVGDQLLSVGFDFDEQTGGFRLGGYLLRYDLDGRWDIVDGQGKVVGTPIHARVENRYGAAATIVEAFGVATNIYPGFAPEDQPRVQRLRQLSGMFFLRDVHEGMEKFTRSDSGEPLRWILAQEKFEHAWDGFIERFDRLNEVKPWERVASAWPTRINEFLRRYTSLQPEDYDLLHAYRGDYSFEQLAYMTSILNATNRMYAPTVLGEQVGNQEASEALQKISGKILAARRQEMDEYGD